ncbi:2Fe-2S iron-sulfur cluster binding domain-containing protein [Caballeronia calidae]|uniref:2Fe-2S iron-sulfur cluster binding domain-containing protein n=2 Tax=Caballeronia calidae TaxID=1777139 RepID=A0A158BDT6_9BURK|nr:2Fe-2S iron-sulfur cluster binding domain-containing protein [Caballeronia calidae]
MRTTRNTSSGDAFSVALGEDASCSVTLALNGVMRGGACETRELLSDFLRHELGATGTHVGCEHGVCGACTVLVDGVAARSCLMLAVQADGRRIDTVEGLSSSAQTLGDLQEAFARHHALQCGFCTAGILMSCTDFLQRVPNPDEEAVREMLSGHLCRCTGYTPIVAAVLDVAKLRQAQSCEQEASHV